MNVGEKPYITKRVFLILLITFLLLANICNLGNVRIGITSASVSQNVSTGGVLSNYLYKIEYSLTNVSQLDFNTDCIISIKNTGVNPAHIYLTNEDMNEDFQNWIYVEVDNLTPKYNVTVSSDIVGADEKVRADAIIMPGTEILLKVRFDTMYLDQIYTQHNIIDETDGDENKDTHEEIEETTYVDIPTTLSLTLKATTVPPTK